jgi:DNA repair exonuclease SbcCD ATPase subunit
VIPQRIKLKGFLSYKGEQEVAFDDGGSLWMLSGLNGSGKSSIFDALTYALFGCHRGGGRDAVELINKDEDSLLVEFDFLLDGRLCRAKRTLKRKARGGGQGTQQILVLGGAGKWTPIEETSYKRGFDEWVEANIGLTYETFTSSVLLLQGQAEKLLSSRPEDRRKVLASIVDLERYERLHEKADERRKALRGSLEALQNQRNALPEVTEMELLEAGGRIEEAERGRMEAQAEVDRLQGLELRAHQWVELQGRVQTARQRWERAARLLADAADIENAAVRLAELRAVLPKLTTIIELRNKIRESEQKTKERADRRFDLDAELTRKCESLDQRRGERDQLWSRIEHDEAGRPDAAAAFRQMVAALEKLKEYEAQDADLARCVGELSQLPADAGAALAAARDEHRRLTALAEAVRSLTRFAGQRDELRRAVERRRLAEQQRNAVLAQGKQYAAELSDLQPRLEEAKRQRREADAKAIEARTRLQQADQSLRELSRLDGAKVCRQCGQELTPGHIVEEKARRGKARAEAEGRDREATAAQEAACKQEERLRARYDGLEKARQEARERFQEQKGQAERAEDEALRLQQDCRRVWDDLPPEHRTRIAAGPLDDWTETTHPAAADLDLLRRETLGVAAADKRVGEADRVRSEWVKKKAEEATIRQNLARLRTSLPPDLSSLRRDHARLEAEFHALDKTLAGLRSQAEQAQRDCDRLAKEAEHLRHKLVEIDGQAKADEASRHDRKLFLDRALKELPAGWADRADGAGLKDWSVWDGERAALERAGADARGKELEQARRGLEDLRRDKEELENQETAFDADCRRDPAEVRVLLKAAKETLSRREDDLRAARGRRERLEEDRKRRNDVAAECVRTEQDHAEQKLLAELLGKDRLQLYLVRQAERQAVFHANSVLDRLSGGQLYLRLKGGADGEGEGSTDRALDLEVYNRVTGDKPIGVAFLSGSQKFRVAVSLALGIGQYASRQHRPIESVIIDEGFGCLDRQGRQVMIQELQNLRGQMRCIVLVSHQEEFADSFSDGYHFQLEDGATRISRFQK